MKTAFEHGVNFYDNAEVYSNGQSEIEMGNAIKELGWRRSDIVVRNEDVFILSRDLGSVDPSCTSFLMVIG